MHVSLVFMYFCHLVHMPPFTPPIISYRQRVYSWVTLYAHLLQKPPSQTCSGEKEVAKLVEGDGHHSVCEVEGLLYPVTMVNINVDVQDSGVVPVRGEGIECERGGAGCERGRGRM